MYRIDNATATATLNAPSAPGPIPNGYFTKGSPGLNVQATIVDDEWLNMLQEELCNVITAASVVLNKADRTQLLNAIRVQGGGAAIGDTPPSSPRPGALWWDSTGGNLFIWYTDVDSSQWVQVNSPVSL